MLEYNQKSSVVTANCMDEVKAIMSEFEKSTNPQQVEMSSRHIQEMGGLFARFLDKHPEIDPNFVDDMTEEQETEWGEFNKDMRITQQIELYESTAEQQ